MSSIEQHEPLLEQHDPHVEQHYPQVEQHDTQGEQPDPYEEQHDPHVEQPEPLLEHFLIYIESFHKKDKQKVIDHVLLCVSKFIYEEDVISEIMYDKGICLGFEALEFDVDSNDIPRFVEFEGEHIRLSYTAS